MPCVTPLVPGLLDHRSGLCCIGPGAGLPFHGALRTSQSISYGCAPSSGTDRSYSNTKDELVRF
eukprot:COSAG02_NODE_29793_length_563_cov_0.556034_1_plen_63_part_10